MGIMFSMNVRISLIALGFIPLIVLYSAFFYSRIAKRFRTADEAEGVLSQHRTGEFDRRACRARLRQGII